MGDTGARRLRRAALAGTLVVAATACSGGDGGGAPGRAGGHPVPLTGGGPRR